MAQPHPKQNPQDQKWSPEQQRFTNACFQNRIQQGEAKKILKVGRAQWRCKGLEDRHYKWKNRGRSN